MDDVLEFCEEMDRLRKQRAAEMASYVDPEDLPEGVYEGQRKGGASARSKRRKRQPQPEKSETPEKPQDSGPEAKTKKLNLTPLEATLILARRGNKECLPRLRRALDEHPELWQHFGNLALQSQESWLRLIAGKDLYLAESLRRHLDAMRSELAGPSPSPLDKLLVDRVLACNVQVLYFDAIETTDSTAENMRVARYRMDRRDQAHKQFLSAVKMLATVRNLVARTQTIQVQLINPPLVHPPATSSAPIVGARGGDEPVIGNGQAAGVGVNRWNSRNRMAGIMETAAVGRE